MKRRDFMLTVGVATLFAGTARAENLSYSEGLVAERLAAGETLFLGFNADWCTTCARQERVMAALRRENPAYDEAVTFIDIHWDQFGRSEIVDRYNVPRRSTLIVLKGDQEIGRIVAGTQEAEIQALMDAALSAATS